MIRISIEEKPMCAFLQLYTTRCNIYTKHQKLQYAPRPPGLQYMQRALRREHGGVGAEVRDKRKVHDKKNIVEKKMHDGGGDPVHRKTESKFPSV